MLSSTYAACSKKPWTGMRARTSRERCALRSTHSCAAARCPAASLAHGRERFTQQCETGTIHWRRNVPPTHPSHSRSSPLQVDPIRDLEIIANELRLKDIAMVEKLLDPLKKEVRHQRRGGRGTGTGAVRPVLYRLRPRSLSRGIADLARYCRLSGRAGSRLRGAPWAARSPLHSIPVL